MARNQKTGYQGVKSNPRAPKGRSRAAVRRDYEEVDLGKPLAKAKRGKYGMPNKGPGRHPHTHPGNYRRPAVTDH